MAKRSKPDRKPRRHQRRRGPNEPGTPEIPNEAIYVGRPTKWGNPFSISDTCTREESVALFEDYLRKMKPAERKAYLAPLKGKDLVCWCPLDEICHADVLLKWANQKE